MSDVALSEVSPEAGAEPNKADALEAEKRSQGWVPKDEWKGDPEKWKPAEKWKSPEEVWRDKFEKSEAKRAADKKESELRFKNLERMSAQALNLQRQQIEDKYEEAKKAAVKTGDEDAYERADAAKTKALKRLDDEADKPEIDDTPKGMSKKDIAAVEDWKAENTWFDRSPRLRGAADEHFADIREESPGMSMSEVLEEVKKRVADEFPEKFGRKPNGASRVEGGSRDMGGGDNRSAFSKLPAEVRAQADQFIDEGLFLEKGETKDKDRTKARERYATEYLKDSK